MLISKQQETFRLLMHRDLEFLGCRPPPAVFAHEGPPLPLKLQIDLDLLARYPDADPTKVHRWFVLWVSRLDYMRAVCFGTDRYDLDGNPAGQISASHREHARRIIVANRKKPDAAPAPTAATPVRRTPPARPILTLPSLQRSTAA